MKTLVVLSHPNFAVSRLNKALANAAKNAGAEVRHLEGLYGTDALKIDVAAEQEAFLRADRIVFLFPMMGFGVPSMLKAYIDYVLSRGFAYGQGAKIAGKQLQIAVSAGGGLGEYSKHGAIKFTLNEILLPLQCCADFCELVYGRIFASCGVEPGVPDSAIEAHAARFTKLLNDELEEHEYQI